MLLFFKIVTIVIMSNIKENCRWVIKIDKLLFFLYLFTALQFYSILLS